MVLNSFYKNMVLTMVLFLFTFFSGYSGQSLFEDNVSGCALPLHCTALCRTTQTPSPYISVCMYLCACACADLHDVQHRAGTAGGLAGSVRQRYL